MRSSARISLKTKITTPLFEESIQFYERVFQMGVLERWDKPEDRGAILEFGGGTGEAYLEIYYGSESHDFTGLSLQFRVEDVDQFRDELPAGVHSKGPVPRPWGSRYLYLTDPNGIVVIVYSGGN